VKRLVKLKPKRISPYQSHRSAAWARHEGANIYADEVIENSATKAIKFSASDWSSKAMLGKSPKIAVSAMHRRVKRNKGAAAVMRQYGRTQHRRGEIGPNEYMEKKLALSPNWKWRAGNMVAAPRNCLRVYL